MTRLLLLHGLGADRNAFQRFLRLLPDGWDAQAADLLGHGDAPKPASGYTLDAHADHVALELAERWPMASVPTIEPALLPVLAGHSYGAAAAVATAARHPGLLRGIVLLDPVVRLDVSEGGHGQEASRTRQMMDAKRAGHLEQTVAALFPDASPALQRWTAGTWERMHQGVVDELDPDFTRYAGHVDVPVAIIHGEQGHGGAGDLAADWFDEPHVAQVDGAGHYLHATHARETVSELDRAVAWIDAGAAVTG